jgi:CBS domain containing-hemolysin-like protein
MEIPLLSELGLPIALFFLALLIRATFAFLETSITALRLFKLKELAHSITGYDSLFAALEKNPHRVLVTTLIASSVADVATASLGTFIIERVFAYYDLSSGLGFSAGIALTSMIMIVFGEIIPKNLAKTRGETIFKSVLWLINAMYYALYPLVSILNNFCDAVVYRIGGQETLEGASDLTSEREIRFLIDHIHAKGLMETEKTAMIHNIFELGRTPVKEIMVPSTDVVSIDIETPLKDALCVFSEHYFTRLPVYQGKPDNIIGMVHLKDLFILLSRGEDKPLKQIVRPIMFIPESVKVNQLLREFRAEHVHIAIVLNEHGSVTGLITLEDVLEEIVGDISDEHEATSEKIIPLSQGGWLVDASITLEELENFFNITFETEDSVTLGGFLTEQLQHLPKKGERTVYRGYCFQIQKASPKRVQQVLVFQEEAAQNNAYEDIE